MPQPPCPVCFRRDYVVRAKLSKLTVLRCRGCDLHLSVRHGGGNPDAYYESLNGDAYEAYYGPFRRRVFSENWARIGKWLKGGRSLDVGASYGWFPEVAPHGWRAEGIEPSDEVADLARRRGIAIRTGTLESIPATDRFDLITLWNVFEHLPNPKKTLHDIHSRLNTDGMLAMCVPNRTGLFNRLGYIAASLGVRSPLEALYQTNSSAPHRFHYRIDDLVSLLERNGFEVLTWHRQPIVDITNLEGRAKLESGGSIAALPLGRFLMHFVIQISDRTGMSDEIAIYARRST